MSCFDKNVPTRRKTIMLFPGLPIIRDYVNSLPRPLRCRLGLGRCALGVAGIKRFTGEKPFNFENAISCTKFRIQSTGSTASRFNVV